MAQPYAVFDLETTVWSKAGRKASPFDDRNWIVMAGVKYPSDNFGTATYYADKQQAQQATWFTDMLAQTKLLVGHNIKFDLQYAMVTSVANRQAYIQWVANGGQIWDTQLAEYLLEGMGPEAQYLKLDEVAPRYGGNTKHDPVKELWEAGVNTCDIDRDMLHDYLVGFMEGDRKVEGDLGNTELILKGQLRRARKHNQLRSLLLNMGGLMYTIEAEYNGMHTDLALGMEIAGELEEELRNVKEELQSFLPDDLPFEFNWGSRTQLSALIFGGSVRYRARLPVLDDNGAPTYVNKKVVVPLIDENGNEVLFKSGKRKGEVKTRTETVPDLERPKTRMEDCAYKFDGFTEPSPEWESSTPGVYSTAAGVLAELGERDIPFLKTLARYAALTKDLGTYFITEDGKGGHSGMLTLVDNNTIHHNLNMTSTVTGRLSSSRPNLQNLSSGGKSRVKEVFTSRFTNGKIIQSDFSALEIYIQAILTGSVNMIEDLRNGLDMHCMRVAQKMGIPYDNDLLLKCKGDKHTAPIKEWAQARKYAKIYSFQRAYGAGVAKIAKTTGMSVEEAQAFADADEERYPEITPYYEQVRKVIEDSAVPTGQVVAHPDFRMKSVALSRGFFRTPDNKLYSYRQQPAPRFVVEREGKWAGFSPTEIKNYVVQGTGAEWAKAAMWIAVRCFYRMNNFDGKALLVNQVHDACYVDADESVALHAAQLIHACMEAASPFMQWYFDWQQPLDVPSDTTWGSNMGEEDKIDDLYDGLDEVQEFVRKTYRGH